MRVEVCLIALAVTACTVGPNYTPPKPPDISQWNDKSARNVVPVMQQTVTEQSNPDPKWWGKFNDPVLTQVMQKAISGNLDLQQAVLRVVEAHQAEIVAGAAGLPTVGGTGSYMREQFGIRGLLLSQGVDGQLNSLANPNSPLNTISPGLGSRTSTAIGGALNGVNRPVNLYQYGLNSSWELDLFGRVRRSEEQAHANTEAQMEATNDALVMLEGQVAQAYVQLRGAQALLVSQQENVRTAQASLNLTATRQRQGLATDLDVEQARTQLDTTQSALPGYEKQSQQAMNRLSVLTGQPPGTLDTMLGPSAPLPQPPAMIAIGMPSTLARRRPDVREAEAQLHAATANVGVAVASFYPDVSLTGSFGLRALDAGFLTNWASSFYSFGPSISLPIFQGGKLTANLQMAHAQQAAAALSYRGTVLNALREVEDALVAYRTDRVTRDKLLEAVHSGETTLYLARDRYSQGLSDFIQVLDSERTLIQTRQQLVQANVMLTNDATALYDALGGGWEDETSAVQAKPSNVDIPPVPAALDTVAARQR
jgi:outer membrane protein, multidrug efflux system